MTEQILRIECCYVPFVESTKELEGKKPKEKCQGIQPTQTGKKHNDVSTRLMPFQGYESDHQGIVHCFIIVDLNVD